MFTSIDKAIAGAIMAVITLLSHFGIMIPDFVDAEYVSGIAAVLTPFVIWIVPNKTGTTKSDNKTLLMLLPLMLLPMLHGCETLGYGDVKIDTARKSILVANAELKSANLLVQDLLRRDVISATQAQRALDNLTTAHDELQTALNAVDANGDPLTADNARERALRTIGTTMALLAPFVPVE